MRTILLSGLLLLAPAASHQALALTFVVTSASDQADVGVGNGVCATSTDVCTLRAAMQEANAVPGPDIIRFAIGSGLQTISVSSALPAISDPVVIDAATQPEYAGAPLIVVNGNGQGGPGFLILAGNTTIRGFAVGNFNGHGVELRNTGGNVLEGNYIGLAADGRTPAANTGHGVVITGAPNNRIGGPGPGQRNVISNNTGQGNGGGILLDGGGGNTIQGNFIGTDLTGTLQRMNEARGIALSKSSNNLIGGPNPGEGNLIAGNRATGIRLLSVSNDNVIQGNFIGVNRTLTDFIMNDRGVQIRDGFRNKVLGNLIAGNRYDGVVIWNGGSNNLVEGNIIAYNGHGPWGVNETGYFGVWVAEGTGNAVVSNRIFGNYSLGINLGLDGDIAVNDAGDADTGANGMQNYPRLTSATRGASSTAVVGFLNSAPQAPYRIQFFASTSCDPSGVGEGEYFIGDTSLATNGTGRADFAIAIPALVPAGWAVTTTATDAGGNTSEFSPCIVVK